MRNPVLLALLIFSFASTAHGQKASAQQKAKRAPGAALIFTYNTGENWRKLDADEKRLYLAGFFDGYHHGLFLLASEYGACDWAAAETQGLLAVDAEQLADALDQFYADALNRVVTIPDAATHLVRQIKGEPNSELQKDLEAIRKSGAFQADFEKRDKR